jgi:hypothetical protein
MALRTQPTAPQDAMASWWPSRYGADDQTGALNCKLHGLDNLYVVDSSFFVSSTAVNPTLTIIANALWRSTCSSFAAACSASPCSAT